MKGMKYMDEKFVIRYSKLEANDVKRPLHLYKGMTNLRHLKELH